MSREKIQKILNKIGPLSSQQLIERFISMLKEVGISTLSKKEMDRIRMFASNDCKDLLEESLEVYLEQGIVFYKKNKEKASLYSSPVTAINKKKKAGKLYSGGKGSDDPLMDSLEKQHLYEQRRTTSQYDRFEYGISDW